MEFILFNAAKYDSQWWIAICGLHIGDSYAALLHVERSMGVWKLDVAWLRELYLWCNRR